MAARDEIMLLDSQSERLGLLWRNQGQKFLDEQAESLMEDVERLRESYLAGIAKEPRAARRTPKVIDLRDATVSGMACTRKGHGHTKASARCTRCGDAFCADCLVPMVDKDKALCTECALIVTGVSHKRPVVSHSRTARKAFG